jgi:NADH-quinone oxidoreductase subunit J
VAVIAAVMLTLRKRENTRYQNPSRQVAVKASERIRIVKMPSAAKSEATP